MPAYVIVDSDVTDPEQYAAYREAAGPAVEAYGGRFLVRGGAMELLEGDWAPTRVVVVEFPDMETVHRWYESPEYRHARSLREGAAHLRMVAVEGL